MAISWNVNIQVLERERKVVRISAQRIDDELPAEQQVTWSHSVDGGASLDADGVTPEQIKTKLISLIWGAYQDYLNRKTQDAVLVSSYETDIASGLLVKEGS